MKMLFRVHMVTRHVVMNRALVLDMFVYAEQEAFESRELDKSFIEDFPEYHLSYVNIASDIEKDIYTQGYNMGYNKAKEEQ